MCLFKFMFLSETSDQGQFIQARKNTFYILILSVWLCLKRRRKLNLLTHDLSGVSFGATTVDLLFRVSVWSCSWVRFLIHDSTAKS